MQDLPQAALVTGASRGIGRSIALRLAKAGWHLLLVDVCPIEETDQVCSAIREQSGTAEAFVLDISDQESVSSFFQEKIKGHYHLQILVNNAGITKDGLIIRMKPADWEKVLKVNLEGSFFCLQEASKIMIRQKSGRIINISSVVAQMGNPGQANYVTSKAGLIGLTKSSALELASRGITVNAVAPGFIATEMTEKLSEEVKQKYLERIPLGEFGRREDVVNAVAFLASDQAAYITGQVLGVNGGIYL